MGRQTKDNKAECRQTNKPQQGGMPPTRRNTTRIPADTTRTPPGYQRIPPGYQRIPPGYHPDTSGYHPDTTRILADTARIPLDNRQQDKTQPGGMPPNQQTTTRRNAAKQTKTEVKTISRKQMRRLKKIDIGFQLKKQRFYIKNTRIRSGASNLCSLRKSIEFQTLWT